MTEFEKIVFAVVKKIPRGATLTYKEVASRAGRPRAYRAIGNILSKNADPKTVPCHRVIRSDGATGGYRWGKAKKAVILRQEKFGQGNSA